MKHIKLFEQIQYWGEKGAGILPICLKTKRLLIPLRSRFVFEPNTWGVWGGKIDLGKNDNFEETENIDLSIEHAAKREFIEETEYYDHIKLIPAYVYVDGSFSYHNFFGIVDSEFEPKLNWETNKFSWMSYDDLLILPKKHFGLIALLKNSKNELEKLIY